MLKRNKDAEKVFPHYVLYHRNENAYQLEFKQNWVSKSEEDARKFIEHDFISEFDEWRVVRVDEGGVEDVVYRVNC